MGPTVRDSSHGLQSFLSMFDCGRRLPKNVRRQAERRIVHYTCQQVYELIEEQSFSDRFPSLLCGNTAFPFPSLTPTLDIRMANLLSLLNCLPLPCCILLSWTADSAFELVAISCALDRR